LQKQKKKMEIESNRKKIKENEIWKNKNTNKIINNLKIKTKFKR
jgi:hypothetical protein